MATTYDGIPSLVDRIIASDLIVTGTVRRLVDLEPDQTQREGRIFGIFELDVDDALKGDLPAGPLLVRILGEGNDERARWIVPLQPKRRFVLLLVSDIGLGPQEEIFAPIFASGFLLDDEGAFSVPSEFVDNLTLEVAGFDGGRIRLDGLHGLVQVVDRQHAEQLEQLEETLPPGALERPYPEMKEMPSGVVEVLPGVEGLPMAGGQPAEIESPETAGE